MLVDRRFTSVLVLVLASLLAGCVQTELKVTNQTGGDIQFTTAHTGKTYAIPAKATRTVPHTTGAVSITTLAKQVWDYDPINVPDLHDQTIKGIQRLTLPVTVEPDGMIVLPNGKKLAPKESRERPAEAH